MIFLSEYQKGVVWILISAFSFAFLGIFGKFAYKEDINSITLLFLRFTFASVILFVYVMVKKISIHLNRKNLLVVLFLGGICYAGASFTYFQALHYLSVGVLTLILYTHLIFVALLAVRFLDEDMNKKLVFALLLAFSGVGFIVFSSSGMEVNIIGVAFILANSLIYSGYIIISKTTVPSIDSRVMGIYVMASAAGTFFIIGMSTGELQITFTVRGVFLTLLIALIPTVVAMVTYFEGLKYVHASRVSIISTVEPVGAVIFGFLLLGETLSLTQILGGTLIVLSILLLKK
ncbi:MAG: DMT family transporter [Candidatus Methanofastidiosia archaeon]|jgi:drug/metabolite transporter (DMT)-like permease